MIRYRSMLPISHRVTFHWPWDKQMIVPQPVSQSWRIRVSVLHESPFVHMWDMLLLMLYVPELFTPFSINQTNASLTHESYTGGANFIKCRMYHRAHHFVRSPGAGKGGNELIFFRSLPSWHRGQCKQWFYKYIMETQRKHQLLESKSLNKNATTK